MITAVRERGRSKNSIFRNFRRRACEEPQARPENFDLPEICHLLEIAFEIAARAETKLFVSITHQSAYVRRILRENNLDRVVMTAARAARIVAVRGWRRAAQTFADSCSAGAVPSLPPAVENHRSVIDSLRGSARRLKASARCFPAAMNRAGDVRRGSDQPSL